jgi:hypothetical protein
MNLPEVFRVQEVIDIMRGTMLCVLGAGTASLVAASLAGYPLVGVGLCLGLVGAGTGNRAFQRSTARIIQDPAGRVRRQVGSRTLVRLGLMTGAAFALLALSRSLGAGAVAGLALFYFLMVVNVVRVLLKSRRHAR